ncbi:ribonuclease H-like domain-containing protein, partial [Tanacetum coccineum]
PSNVNLVRSMWLFKPAAIRTVLSLAVSFRWPIHQLDVKNAFLSGDLSETRSLYGLKQAPRAWFQRFASYATRAGFSPSRCDSSLFIYTQGSQDYFCLRYARHSTGLFLSQKKYALQLLERAHMVNCNPSRTPVDTDSKLGPDDVPVQDPTLYRSLARGL